MFLPDVIVWLALAFESHIHHSPAKGWFESEEEDGCAFCRLTQPGFLRLASNPKAFGEEAVSLNRAWQLYDAFLDDPRVTFAQEPENLEAFWRSYAQSSMVSPKVWNDAYLAAFARASEFHLVTFDKGFTQYREVTVTILT